MEKVFKFLNTLENSIINSTDQFSVVMIEVIKQTNDYEKSQISAVREKLINVSKLLQKYDDIVHEAEAKLHNPSSQFVLAADDVPIDHLEAVKSVLAQRIQNHTIIRMPTRQVKKLTHINGVDLQTNTLTLPVIDKIEELPPAFYWFDGDLTHKKGIYTCLGNGFYVKVAFPNMIAGTNKIKSIRCKYGTLKDCERNKKKISEVHKSDIRKCQYVHRKEKFNKVGSIFRCEYEQFGMHESLNTDLDKVDRFDIRHLLMYSLSDDLLTLIWYQNKFKDGNLFLSGLDTF